MSHDEHLRGPDPSAAGGPLVSGSPSDGVLSLIRLLSERLQKHRVTYCHWKSNEALHRSLSGDNDLDLLVSDRDMTTVVPILTELGFLPAGLPPDRRVPGLDDYFGIDEETGRLVHVQVHARLVVGDDMTKNFHIPVEEPYLASRRWDGVLPVPAAEFEYAVFLLRMAVKHCPLDAILMRRGRLTPSERRELVFLEGRVDRGYLASILDDHLPWVDIDALDTIRAALAPDAPVLVRAGAGRRALALLRPFGRRRPAVDLWLRVFRRISRRAETRPGKGPGYKKLARGVIAVIGGDGAGKSSLVEALFQRLGSQFMTAKIHMGKPPRSMLSRAVRRLFRGLGLTTSAAEFPPWSEFEDGFPGVAHLMGNALVARDRLRQARRARGLAGRGYLVLSDRYPLSELSTMDTLRNTRIAERFPTRSARALAAWERRFHAAIPPPDLTIVLRVSPDVAVRRRSDQDGEFVRTRAEEVVDTRWLRPSTRVVDADRDPEQVLVQALNAVWQWLTGREERAVAK